MLSISAHHHEFLRSLLGTDDYDLVFEVVNGNVIDIRSIAAKETDFGLLNS